MELSLVEKQKIEEKVTALLKAFNYSLEKDTHVDVVEFCNSQGFTVGNADLKHFEDGFLAITTAKDNSAEKKVIGVNAERSLEYKRFVIAHEFAHSVLHYKQGQVYLHRDNVKGKDESENDADYFAAALLMPAESFKRSYAELKGQGVDQRNIPEQLASIYKVPLDSVKRRIEEVKLA